MLKAAYGDRISWDEVPADELPIERSLSKATNYQRKITAILALEAAEVMARVKAKPPKPPKPKPSKPVATHIEYDTAHKIVWFPITHDRSGKPLINRDGEPYTKFVPLGFRITLDHSGAWWFYHLRCKTWTKHMPPQTATYQHRGMVVGLAGAPVRDEHGDIVQEPGRVIRFGKVSELVQRLKHCSRSVALLLIQKGLAERELEELMSRG